MPKPEAIIIAAAFNMLRPTLESLPNAPHSVTAFYDLITGATPPVPQPVPAGKAEKAETFLSVKEFSRRLGVTTKTIHNMLNDGRLQHLRAGKIIRIPESAIAALLTSRKKTSEEVI
jgi:excisionase family DNA binding protein